MDHLVPLLLFGLLGAAVVSICASRTRDRTESNWLRRTLTIAFALRFGAATLFATVEQTRVFHEDAQGSEGRGLWIAELWQEGASTEQIKWNDDKNHGYYFFCAACYYVVGRYRAVPSYVNCLLGVITLLFVYRMARRYFHVVVARRATWLLAVTPSMVLWSATAIKDTLVTLLIVLTLDSCMRLRERLSVGAVLGTFLLPLAVYPIRFYIVYFLVAAIFASFLITKRVTSSGGAARNLLIGAALLTTLSLVGASGQASNDSSYFTLDRASHYRMGMAQTAHSGFAGDVDISTPGRALLFFPYGLSVLLFGPFPWQFRSFLALLTLPEMLFWWSRIPALLRGTRFLLRRRLVEVAPLLVFSLLLTVAYSLIHGNVGSGYRQRAQIFVFLFVFTALGEYLKVCRKRATDEDILLQGDGARADWMPVRGRGPRQSVPPPG